MTTEGTQRNQEREKSSYQKLKQKRMEKSSHQKLKQKRMASFLYLQAHTIEISLLTQFIIIAEFKFRLFSCLFFTGPFRGKNHVIRDRGLSKVNEHTVMSGGVRGALPSMAPEPFRGKSRLVTDKITIIEDRKGGCWTFLCFFDKQHLVFCFPVDSTGLHVLDLIMVHLFTKGLYYKDYDCRQAVSKYRLCIVKNYATGYRSSDASMKHKGLDKMDYSRSGPGKRNPIFLGGGSKKRTLNEDLEDHLEVNSRRTDIHIDGPQSEEHIGSTSNGTTVTRKETRALSATKRNRLNNRKLVFEVDDCAGRIVGEDSQTFITTGGCLVRESAK
ncbi:hypothetical protein Tco_0962996 [Tanacetum coccineum]